MRRAARLTALAVSAAERVVEAARAVSKAGAVVPAAAFAVGGSAVGHVLQAIRIFAARVSGRADLAGNASGAAFVGRALAARTAAPGAVGRAACALSIAPSVALGATIASETGIIEASVHGARAIGESRAVRIVEQGPVIAGNSRPAAGNARREHEH